MSRYDALIAELRAAAKPGREAPAGMTSYLDKVRTRAYEVTDADVEELKRSYSEDEIFEHTVSVATAAGLERLDAALEVLR